MQRHNHPYGLKKTDHPRIENKIIGDGIKIKQLEIVLLRGLIHAADEFVLGFILLLYDPPESG